MFGRAKVWHSGLSKASKVMLWSVTAVIAGSAINAAANPSSGTTKPEQPTTVQATSKTPVITKKTTTETADIAFAKTTVDDGNLTKGKTEIKTVGVNGVKTFTYEVTYQDGKETDKKLLKEEVTTAPVTEVTAVGTYVYVAPKQSCDPNYSGACVPIASDVDCMGGSGNGPAYVQGPVYVIGSDIYGLDKDGNGIGCE
jgi:resuscitation-promoting factor RpfB